MKPAPREMQVKAPVSDDLMARFSRFVTERLGLHWPQERWPDLERKLAPAAREFGCADEAAFVEWAVSSPLTQKQIEALASHLTVGETYFFREKQAFEILEAHVLPELIRRRGAERRLRIWSAGCCTGEEPYSLAILISRMIPRLKDWNVTLLATDINPRFLHQAAAGVYGRWSFRGAPTWLQEQYFTPRADARYEVLPALKEQVTFSYLNLAEDVYPSLANNTNAMDVIFCRNVLMYFSPERARRVAENLHRALVDGGWLIVSPSEVSQATFSQFAAVNFPGATLYQKDSRKSHPTGTPPAWTPPATSAVDHLAGDDGFPHAMPPAVEVTPAGERVEPPRDPHQEALALYRRGQYAEAVERLSGQASPAALALAARAHANQGQLVEALAGCDQAITADKLNPALRYLRALILQEQRQVDEARASLREALYLDPRFILAHFALGNLASRQARPREAAKHFENTLALLHTCRPEEGLPEGEGLTAGRLAEMIRAAMDEAQASDERKGRS